LHLYKPIWTILYPDCFAGSSYVVDDGKDHDGGYDEYDDGIPVCSDGLLHSMTYSVVLGVILGMSVLGTFANRIGRRAGSILTASLMAFGALGMALISLVFEDNPATLFGCMSGLLFVFGIGVGGEYPLSAASSNERAMVEMRKRMNEESAKSNDGGDAGRMSKRRMYGPALGSLSGIAEAELGQSTGTTTTNLGHDAKVDAVDYALYGDKANELENGGCGVPRRQPRIFIRGRKVLLVFTMQGIGVFVQTLTLTFLLLVTRQLGNISEGNRDDDYDDVDNSNYGDDQESLSGVYDAGTLLGVWQITYSIGAAILVFVLISRTAYLKESEVWAADKEKRNQATRSGTDIVKDVNPLSPHRQTESKEGGRKQVQGPSEDFGDLGVANTKKTQYLLLRNYGYRLLGTSLSWLLWDIAFYGNKLFQSSFLVALTGDSVTPYELTRAAALNALIALLGYFAAASIVDYPWVGRLRLQYWGFAVTGTLFFCCGLLKGSLSRGWLMLVYFLSSFSGQCGPNATTFLVPAGESKSRYRSGDARKIIIQVMSSSFFMVSHASLSRCPPEIFPTECRTMCHGISAAFGKAGALIAATLFNYVNEDVQLFLICGYCCFIACIVTFLTIPETTTLDLYELDQQWRMILTKGNYVGTASAPEHLSFIERRLRGCYSEQR